MVQKSAPAQEIASIEKNETARYIISVSEWNDNKYCDIREYYLDQKSDEYKPTKKGVRFQINLLDDFVEALRSIDQDSE